MKKLIVGILAVMVVCAGGLVADEVVQSTPIAGGGITTTQQETYVPQVIIQAKWGNGEGEFGIIEKNDIMALGPTMMTVSKSGNILVADPGNSRVLKYDSTGKYLESIKLDVKPATVDGGDYGMHEDEESGQLFVTTNSGVTKFSKKGNLLEKRIRDKDLLAMKKLDQIHLIKERISDQQEKLKVVDSSGNIITNLIATLDNKWMQDGYYLGGVNTVIVQRDSNNDYYILVGARTKLLNEKHFPVGYKSWLYKYNVDGNFLSAIDISNTYEYTFMSPAIVDNKGNIYRIAWNRSREENGVKIVKWVKMQ